MYSGTVRRVSRQDIKLVNVFSEMEDHDASNDLHKESFLGGGWSAYISWLNVNKKPLHDALGFRKEIDGVTMEFWIQWCLDGFSDTMLGYANSIPTIDGGTHIDGVKDAITRTLNRLVKKSIVFKDEDITISWEHVRKGLTCIITVIVPNPEFEGHTQTRLRNPYVREIVDQSVEEYLTEYFELHPDVLERIVSNSLITYKAALDAKRARELVLSRSVSTPYTVPEKLTNCSSDKIEILIGGGDSSGGAGNYVPNQRLQNKRTREQPRRNRPVSRAPGQCLENTSASSLETKRRIPENCVPSSHARFSSRRTVGSSNPPNHKDVSKKTPKDVTDSRGVCKKTSEDVTNCSEKTKPFIPIGPGFQAEIPVWIAPTKRGKFYGSPGDSDTLRWLGTGVWPTYSLKKKVHYKKVGEGRSDSCSCASPRSTDCIKQHIQEARELLEKQLGRAFYTWKFDEMGEVRSRTWTAKEEQKFQALVKKNPLSTIKGFWKFASKHFPRKSEKDLISYYQNVFLLKRTRSLADSSADHIDSDDDHFNDFLGG